MTRQSPFNFNYDALAAMIAPTVARILVTMQPLDAAGVMAQRNRVYTPESVARMARCRTKRVYDAIKSGNLPVKMERGPRTGVLAGKPRYLIRADDAMAWIDRLRPVVRGPSGASSRFR